MNGVTILLLLHSQLHLFKFFFFFFFLRMWPVFNPTTGVVTFRLRGWFMLGVFLLTAFTRLRHECQELLSPCDGYAYVHRLDLGLYSHPDGVRTYVNSKGKKIPFTGVSEKRRCIPQDNEPNTLPTELFRPRPHDVRYDSKGWDLRSGEQPLGSSLSKQLSSERGGWEERRVGWEGGREVEARD